MPDVPHVPDAAERSAEERRRLRRFALTHHPDRGGDPDDFIAGLADLRRAAAAAEGRPEGGPVVYRRPRGLVGWLGIGRPRPPARRLE